MSNSKKEKILKQYLYTEKSFGADEISKKDLDDIKLGLGIETQEKAEVPFEDWDSLKSAATNCTKCSLCETRTNVVFGEGNPNADLMFVGEAPGRDEDLQGSPFVGRAGKLLTKIIEAMGLTRGDIYIANCLKCRPPQNRNPLPEEIALCSGYLRSQVDLIKPKVICALGKFAAQTLLQTETPISKLRGEFHDYYGTALMPTYHPAYLLRNPSEKKVVWEDMKVILKKMNLPVPRHTK